MLQALASGGNGPTLFSPSKSPVKDALASWLERGSHEVFTVNLTMTPEWAQRLLERNLDNRPLRMKTPNRGVEAYAQAMIRGEWKMNGEAIVLSSEGLLNDGQHRLNAVLLSGCHVPMQVTFGVARDTRHTVDQGAARTPGDVLALAGEKSGNVLAHALQFLWAYPEQKFNSRPSPDQLLQTLEEHPGIRDAFHAVRPLTSEYRLSLGYVSAAYYECERFDAHAAERFTQAATTGLNLTAAGSPVVHLRKRFQKHLAKQDLIPAVEQAALFIKAFNATITRRNVRQLQWRRNGDAAESFPMVGR